MKEIRFVGVDKYIGAVIYNNKVRAVSYAPKEKFLDFVKSILEDFPNYKARCVIDEEMSKYVKKAIDRDTLIQQKMLTDRQR